MFLPLGLFLRLRTFPIVTVLIIIVCFVNHFAFNDLSKIEIQMVTLKEEFQAKKLDMLNKYCFDRGFAEDDCTFSKTKKPAKSKNNKDSKELKEFNTFLKTLSLSNDLLALVKDFENILNEGLTQNSDIANLDGFHEFMIEHENYRTSLNKLIKDNNLLNPENMNIH
jgi:hypothetical protein